MQLRHLLATAAFLASTQAGAEFIRFDDSAAGRLTVAANGFEYAPLTVNGRVFNSQNFQDVSFDFAKGAALNFTGTYYRGRGATDEDTTFLYVYDNAPGTVVAQLQLNRTRLGDNEQAVDGTFYGQGSGFAFGALNSGTVITLAGNRNGPFNTTPAFFSRNLIDGNFDLNVASNPAAIAAGVPEPAAWAMMIGGFGLVGGSLRRRRVQMRVRFA